MAKNDNFRAVFSEPSGQRVREQMRVYDVVQEKCVAVEGDGFSQWVVEAGVIGVAANSGDRRDFLQLEQHSWQTYVATVEDMIDAGK